MRGFLLNINLLHFIDARFLTIEEDEEGNRVDGIFIPLTKNGIKRSKRGAYVNVSMSELDFHDRHHHTHYLRTLMPRDKYFEYVKDLGYKIPILGYASPSNFGARMIKGDGGSNENRRLKKRVGVSAFLSDEE